MGKIFDRNCDRCGKPYKGYGTKYCSPECSAPTKKTATTTQDETKALYEEILQRIEKKPISIHNYFPKNHIKIGLLGDTHCGSLYSRKDILDCLYKVYEKEGIEHVYHTGDILDGGGVYRGQEFELAYHGVNAQVKHCAESYPKIKGIATHFITGNHDLSFYKTAGVDIGYSLTSLRDDFEYLGQEEADVVIQGIRLRLSHPGSGSAYAVSYKIQKMIESITGGEKPNILAVGHYHKAEMLPIMRNIVAVQTGTTQSQTPFMRRLSLAAHLGGWMLEFWVNNGEIVRIKSEYIPFYEK